MKNVEERIAAAEALDPGTWVYYLDESMQAEDGRWLPVKALAGGGYLEQAYYVSDDTDFKEAQTWVQAINEQRGFSKDQADIVILASFRNQFKKEGAK